MEFLASLEQTGVGRYIQESDWGHPVLLVFHAIGMALVVGVVLMVDLRVLGYGRAVPLNAFEKLLGVAWVGFGMNAVSGLLIFCSNATHLIVNWTFQLKLALIVAGGLSVWLLWRDIQARAAGGAGFDTVTARQKLMAVASIVFWIGALVAGRLIAYTLMPDLAV